MPTPSELKTVLVLGNGIIGRALAQSFTVGCFCELLFPELETSPDPPQPIREPRSSRRRVLLSGCGVYDWSQRDGDALLAAGTEELFRHLQRDREK